MANARYFQSIPRPRLFTAFDKAVIRAREKKQPSFYGGMLVCICGATWKFMDERMTRNQYKRFIAGEGCPKCVGGK